MTDTTNENTAAADAAIDKDHGQGMMDHLNFVIDNILNPMKAITGVSETGFVLITGPLVLRNGENPIGVTSNLASRDLVTLGIIGVDGVAQQIEGESDEETPATPETDAEGDGQ